MPELRSVLCPVDRSDVSRQALRAAVSLASAHHAPLHVVEVVDSAFPPLADPTAVLQVQDVARQTLEEDVNWFVAPLLTANVTTSVHVREGRVVTEILRMAADLESPLIVMGTHGRGGFERFVLGSVTEKIVRKASCPVLAVPPSEGDSGLALKRIVCAVDFSPASAAAFAFAQLLAMPASANVALLHVLEWPFGDTDAPAPVLALRHNLEAEAQEHLLRLETRPGARIAERVVRVGKPARDIQAFARDRAADLIVLGSSGRGAVNQAVLGSTAHAVLRDAPCAVLTVPVAG